MQQPQEATQPASASSKLAEKRRLLQEKERALGNRITALGDVSSSDAKPTKDASPASVASSVTEESSSSQQQQAFMDQIAALQHDLLESQQSNETLQAKVTQLQTEVRQNEHALNKSYNDTLEGLTTHMMEMEEHTREVDQDNDKLRFQLTEAQRVVALLETKVTSSESKAQAAAISAQQTQAEQHFQLLEAQRVSKFLQSKLEKVLQEKAANVASEGGKQGDSSSQMEALRQENQDLQEQLHSVETNLSKSYNDTLAGLSQAMNETQQQHDAVVVERDQYKFQATEATRVSQFLQTKLQKVQAELETAKSTPAAPPSEPQNRDEALTEAQNACTNAQRVASFLQQKCESLVQEKARLVQDHEAKVSDLEFQKRDAQRVSQFLQTKLEKVLESQQLQEENEEPIARAAVSSVPPFQDTSSSSDQVSSLQRENDELRAKIEQIKQEAKESEASLNKSYDETLDGLTKHIESLEKHVKKLYKQKDSMTEMLADMDEACEGWEIKCNKAEEAHQEAVAAVYAQLQEQLTEQLTQSQKEHEEELEALQTQLTEALRNANFYQTKMDLMKSQLALLKRSKGSVETSSRSLSIEASMHSKNESVEADASLAELSKQELQDQIVSLRSINESVRAEMEQYKEETDAAEANLSKSYNDTLDRLNAHIEELQKQIQTLQEKPKELEAELDKVQRNNQFLLGKISALEESNVQLREREKDVEFNQEPEDSESPPYNGDLEEQEERETIVGEDLGDIAEEDDNDEPVAARRAIACKDLDDLSDDEDEDDEPTKRNIACKDIEDISDDDESPTHHRDLGQTSLQNRILELEDSLEATKRGAKQKEVKLIMSYKEKIESLRNQVDSLEQTVQDQNSEMDEMREEMREMLEESDEVWQGWEAKLAEAEQAHQAKVAEMQFQLTEAQRMSRSLESTLEKETDESEVIRAVDTMQDESDDLATLQFKLSEAQRVSKYLQSRLEKVLSDKPSVGDGVTSDDGEKEDAASLHFKLTEAQRVSKFLQCKLEKVLDEKTRVENEKEDLAFQLTEARRVSKFLESKLTTMVESESKAVASKIAPNIEESNATESLEMSTEQDKLKILLDEKQAELALLEELNLQLESKVSDLKEEVRATETTLNKSYNETLDGLTNHIETLEHQLTEMDDENHQLRSQLTDAQLLCRLLQSKVSEKSGKEEEDSDAVFLGDVVEVATGEKMEETTRGLGGNSRLASHSETIQEVSEDSERPATKLEIENNDLKYKLTEAQRVCKYLQDKLAESEASSETVIADMKFMATEAQRVSKFLESKVHQVADEKKLAEDRIAELDTENSDLRFGMTEAHRVCKYLQNKLVEWETKQNRVLVDVENKLAESQRVSTLLGKKLNKAIAEKQEAIAENDSLKEELANRNDDENVVNSTSREISSRIATFENEILSTPNIGADKDTEALQSRIAELESTIEETKRNARASETALNKSYDDTLDQLTTHIQETEQHVHELEIQNDEVRFNLTEAQRVCRFLKDKLTKAEQELAEAESSHQLYKADADFKLTESQRVSKFLESKLAKVVEDYEKKMSEADDSHKLYKADVDFKLTETQRVTKFLESKLEKVVAEHEQKLAELEQSNAMSRSEESTRAVLDADKDFNLAEAQRLSKYLESKLATVVEAKESTELSLKEAESARDELEMTLGILSDEVGALSEKCEKTEKDRDTFKEKAYDLGMRMTTLKQELKEKNDAVAELEEQKKELEETLATVKQEAKDNEEHLNKSYDDTLSGLTIHIQEAETRIKELSDENEELRSDVCEIERTRKTLQDKIEEAEKAREAFVSDSQFKLAEAERSYKFVESKVNRMVDEKDAADSKNRELQEQIDKLKAEVVSMDMVVAQQRQALLKPIEVSNSEKSRDLVLPVSATSQANPSKNCEDELIDSLSACLSAARANKKSVEDRISAITAELEGEVEEYKGKWETEVSKNKDLSSKLTDKERQVQKFKGKWEAEVCKNEDLSDKITELEKSVEHQTQGEQTSEVKVVEKKKSGYVGKPVRRVADRPASNPVYFI